MTRFGLCSLPATFQDAMPAPQDHTWLEFLAHLDDIIIFKYHALNLRDVLEKCRAYNFNPNLINFPIVCVVLALNSWNFCSGEQVQPNSLTYARLPNLLYTAKLCI